MSRQVRRLRSHTIPEINIKSSSSY